MLRDELDDIIDEHDDLLDEYGDLNEQLHEKDSLIQEQIAEIRNLIRTKSDLKEARRKIETLKSISKKYIANNRFTTLKPFLIFLSFRNNFQPSI